jgi:hypothetical protein
MIYMAKCKVTLRYGGKDITHHFYFSAPDHTEATEEVKRRVQEYLDFGTIISFGAITFAPMTDEEILEVMTSYEKC